MGLTIVGLIAGYRRHAEAYCRDTAVDLTSELPALKRPVRVPGRPNGRTAAVSFGPLATEAVRNEMIAKGRGRASTDAHVGRLRRLLRWSVSQVARVPPPADRASGPRRFFPGISAADVRYRTDRPAA